MHVTSLLYGAPSMLLRHSLGRDYVRRTLPSMPAIANIANRQKTALLSSSGDRVGLQVVSVRLASAIIASPTFVKIPICAQAAGRGLASYVSNVTQRLPEMIWGFFAIAKLASIQKSLTPGKGCLSEQKVKHTSQALKLQSSRSGLVRKLLCSY